MSGYNFFLKQVSALTDKPSSALGYGQSHS